MIRCAAACLLIAGACSYAPLPKLDETSGAGSGEPTVDAAPPVFCDPSDPHLVACYEFEGNARDGSSHHVDPTTSNVTFGAGPVGQAIQFFSNSTTDVADKPALDVAALTIEAWIQPSQLPTGSAHAYILDADQQYAFWLAGEYRRAAPAPGAR